MARRCVVLALFAITIGGCRFEVAGLDEPRSDGGTDVPDLGDLGGGDLAIPSGDDLAGVDLRSPIDLAPPPDLTDPCTPAPVPIVNGVIARCAIGNPPTVNGRVEEWVTTPSYVLRSGASGVVDSGFTGRQGSRDLDLSGTFQLRWDETALYVAVSVVDDLRAISATPTSLWQGDSVEIYVSSTGAGQYGANDMQLVLAPNGSGSYYRGDGVPRALPSGVVVMARNVGGAAGWEMEVAIPWSVIGGQGALGRLVRFDLQLNDSDLSPTRERYLLWRLMTPQSCTECGGARCEPFCSTATFDTLQLGGR